jgi:hypothetical protein
MDPFNDALSEHPPYPIEINFCEGQQWNDFERLRGLFKRDN